MSAGNGFLLEAKNLTREFDEGQALIAGEYAIGLEMVNAHAAISSALGAPVRWVPLDAVTTTLQVAGVTAAAGHAHL